MIACITSDRGACSKLMLTSSPTNRMGSTTAGIFTCRSVPRKMVGSLDLSSSAVDCASSAADVDRGAAASTLGLGCGVCPVGATAGDAAPWPVPGVVQLVSSRLTAAAVIYFSMECPGRPVCFCSGYRIIRFYPRGPKPRVRSAAGFGPAVSLPLPAGSGGAGPGACRG